MKNEQKKYFLRVHFFLELISISPTSFFVWTREALLPAGMLIAGRRSFSHSDASLKEFDGCGSGNKLILVVLKQVDVGVDSRVASSGFWKEEYVSESKRKNM